VQGINQLTRDGLLRPLIDRIFSFEQVVEAHRYMETCPSRGRVVLQV
jgi:NADPH:quinone reductase-like Zn-dependent oxidoreductase